MKGRSGIHNDFHVNAVLQAKGCYTRYYLSDFNRLNNITKSLYEYIILAKYGILK